MVVGKNPAFMFSLSQLLFVIKKSQDGQWRKLQVKDLVNLLNFMWFRNMKVCGIHESTYQIPSLIWSNEHSEIQASFDSIVCFE